MKLLHLDSSILGPHSVTRILTADIVQRQRALHPGLEVIYRDLAADASLHLSGAHMAAWQGAAVENEDLGQDLAKGGSYLDELFAADIIVIGAPMYNFTVPTQLKAWIDRVVVAGKTFQYSANGVPESLLPKGKKVFIASARGGSYHEGSPAAFLEHHESYLRGVLGFLGVQDVTIVRAEGLSMGPEARQAALSKAKQTVAALAA
jgi:FMN-dependent NADH-azoreductase